MTDPHPLRSIAAAISDGATVDWTAAASGASSPTGRALLDQLRAISLATGGRGRALDVPPRRAWRRAIDLRLLITRRSRHACARSAVWLSGAAPLGYLALHVYVHRNLTVTDIVRGRSSVMLLTAAVAGLAAVLLGRRMLRAIDLRFLGAPPDYPDILARLGQDFHGAYGVRDAAAVLERAVERAVEPAGCTVFLLDESGAALAPPAAAASPLRTRSTLAKVLKRARDGTQMAVDAGGPIGRLLPEEDRRWLTDQGFELLVPLTGSGGDLLGMMALGPRRGGLPFSRNDRVLLATMAGQAGIVIENRGFREVPYRHLATGHGHAGASIGWDDEPGALCPRCRILLPCGTDSCTCGTDTVAAPLPVMVCGKFRVLRLIGSGGMGVVYLAIDVVLDRKVAIKTLPRLTPDGVARLRREARAMAAVPHPNLAMIFGVESWRGAPLLVVEYLDAGTLADRQPQERLTPDEAAALGIVLADVLDQLHASGVLHRDIKPSNIGYTREGAPKLLDFGIARLLGPPAAGTIGDGDGIALAEPMPNSVFESSLTGVDHLACTPLYLCPEALAGAEPDPSFDLWSLSMVLYEAVGGVHPFRDETPEGVFERIRQAEIPDIRSVRGDVPPLLAAIFQRALARDPSRRPRSAGELRNWLHRLRAELRRPLS